MRIVVAPDSFKEALDARSVCEAIARGLEAGFAGSSSSTGWPGVEVVSVPMADGGEGTVAAMVAATGGRICTAQVTDPLGRPVTAEFGILGDGATAVIEMAAASGLHLVSSEERDPLLTSTYGTGELIAAALERRVRRIIVGVGGSATVDGGVGAAQALGAVFRSGDGRPIGRGGGALADLESISLDGLHQALKRVVIEVACDVENPLLGPTGAARVFAPQKGATPAAVERLDANLAHLADVIRRDVGLDMAAVPGAGAAGGLGAGLLAFLGATLRPGADLVIDAVGLEAAVAHADLVITGEGRLDGQSVHGKTPVAVARVAGRHDVPVVALVGALGEGWQRTIDAGITACFGIADRPMDLALAVRRTPDLLAQAAEHIARLLRGTGARSAPRT